MTNLKYTHYKLSMEVLYLSATQNDELLRQDIVLKGLLIWFWVLHFYKPASALSISALSILC